MILFLFNPYVISLIGGDVVCSFKDVLIALVNFRSISIIAVFSLSGLPADGSNSQQVEEEEFSRV